jgi:hypothetical protein
MGKVCSTLWVKRNACRILVGNVGGRRGRPGRRWVDNIKIRSYIGWDDVEWIDLAQDKDQWRAPGSF